MKVKMIIRKSFETMGHAIFIYKEDGEKIFMAKPIDIVFSDKEFEQSLRTEPTISLPWFSEIERPEESLSIEKQIIESTEKHKNAHIDNLNTIINSLFEKVIK